MVSVTESRHLLFPIDGHDGDDDDNSDDDKDVYEIISGTDS